MLYSYENFFLMENYFMLSMFSNVEEEKYFVFISKNFRRNEGQK